RDAFRPVDQGAAAIALTGLSSLALSAAGEADQRVAAHRAVGEAGGLALTLGLEKDRERGCRSSRRPLAERAQEALLLFEENRRTQRLQRGVGAHAAGDP